MTRANQLSKQDQINLASCLPYGTFKRSDAVKILLPYGITTDQVRTVINNAPDVKRIKKNVYYRASKNGTTQAPSKPIIQEESFATLSQPDYRKHLLSETPTDELADELFRRIELNKEAQLDVARVLVRLGYQVQEKAVIWRNVE